MLYLHELLKDWPCIVEGRKFRVPIKGITEHSKRVKQGDLFIARKGDCTDGIAFIEEAIQLGAAAIVIDREISKNKLFQVPIITVPNCLSFLAYASARLAGNPSERLTVIAVTGTNGKTTVTHFIGQMLKEAGVKAAVIGTLGLYIDGIPTPHKLPKLTTLSAEYLHPLLKECEEKDVTHIIMEASSMGLEMERLAYCHIDIGVLLNISEDHYDEHGSKEAYIKAKQRLFGMAKEMIVNCDDPICMEMVGDKKQKVVMFGKSDQAQFQLISKEKDCYIRTPLSRTKLTYQTMEEFNRLNVLSAISTLSVLGIDNRKYEHAICKLKLPEGRMQKIEKDGISVIVDYAHTPDALKLVLETIHATYTGGIIVVFGCGGNRDKGKRKKMGKVAGDYATKIMITSDNPRREDPMKIIDEIAAGIQTVTSYKKIIDRKKAIEYALSIARKGDVILIAGKGHEKTQEIDGQIFPFSDQKIVEDIFFKT